MVLPTDFFKIGSLYESILCSRYIGSDWINSACMGFRLIDEDHIQITPYFETDTINNLVLGKFFSLNLTENPLIYVRSSLYGWNKGAFEPEIDLSEFNTSLEFPILNDSNIAVICEVESIAPFLKNEIQIGNSLKCKIIKVFHAKIPRVYFNREFYLLLESLIAATRAKIAKDRGLDPEKQMYYSIISENFIKIRRFSQDKLIFESVNLIKKWLLDSVDNEFETQWEMGSD